MQQHQRPRGGLYQVCLCLSGHGHASLTLWLQRARQCVCLPFAFARVGHYGSAIESSQTIKFIPQKSGKRAGWWQQVGGTNLICLSKLCTIWMKVCACHGVRRWWFTRSYLKLVVSVQWTEVWKSAFKYTCRPINIYIKTIVWWLTIRTFPSL